MKKTATYSSKDLGEVEIGVVGMELLLSRDWRYVTDRRCRSVRGEAMSDGESGTTLIRLISLPSTTNEQGDRSAVHPFFPTH